MLRSPKRLTAPVALAAVALAVSGCGGGSKGGDETSYVKTYETACKTIADQTAAFEATATGIEKTAAKDPKAAIAQFKEGATKLFTTFGDQLDVMAKADAPGKFSDFQKSIAKNAEQSRTTIDQAKAEVAKISSLEDFSTLGSKLGSLKLTSGAGLPKELGQKAPSCKALGDSKS